MGKSLVVLIACAAVGLDIAPAHAGPCSGDIAQLEQAARRSAANSATGPTAPQSLGAQLGHQPTPDSVKRAQEEAQSRFAAVLARAKAFDADGKREECMQAAEEAKLLLGLN